MTTEKDNADPNTTGEGWLEYTVNLPEEIAAHILAGHKLSEKEYAEVVGAFMRASGANANG